MLLPFQLYSLWLILEHLKQIPPSLHIQEGEDFTIYCNYSSTIDSLQWYKQKPGGSPVFLMIIVKDGDVKKQGRLAAQLGKTRKDSSLHIMATQATDVGTYFCAVTQCSPNTCCLSTNLSQGLLEQLLFSPLRRQRKLKSHCLQRTSTTLPCGSRNACRNSLCKAWRSLMV
uniref:Ig-like domain-containing protein n=1 Tax=Urocitellus parryii TaxID=9999 RepID=A0A8D2HKP5_UROPR